MKRDDVYSPKKALVTGGAGFIGASLVHILVDEGVSTRVMVMPGDPATNLDDLRGRVEVVEGDLLDPASLDRAMDGCDTLFNFAAIYAIWLRTPRLMFDVNVQGSRNVMEAAQRAGVQRIVHTSSIAAVGCRGDGTPADETCMFNEWDVASDYVLSKYISELEVLRMVGEGLPAVICNPAFPFGWGDVGPTPTGEIVRNILRGFPIYFDGGFNAVGVKDVAMGHWLAAKCGQIGRRYILGNENLTYIQFARRVAEIAGIKAPKIRMGRGALLAVGKLGDFVADNITHKTPLAAETTVTYAVGRNLYFDVSRAKDELGYDPAPIEEPIREAVRWFRNRK